MVIEVALAHKIQVRIWAIFGLWYKHGQSRATRRSSQLKYIAINSITYLIELKEKSSDSTGNMKHIILGKNGLAGSNVQMVKNTKPMLPSSPGHLI